MMPNPPLPDDDPTTTSDVPDLGREDDLQRSVEEGDAERAVPSEEERPETADEDPAATPRIGRGSIPTTRRRPRTRASRRSERARRRSHQRFLNRRAG